jgi:serine phosphatase RsbU (regulator of sigma subunit)/tetratricopeptide (TPR) repeat protein
MKKVIYLFFILLNINFSFCQTVSDSLLRELPNAKNDSIKAGLLVALGNESRFSDPKKSEKLYKEALELATKNNYEVIITNTLNNLGVLANVTGDFNLSIEYGNKSLVLAKKYNLKTNQAKSYSLLGVTYYSMGDYVKAKENLNKSLKLAENLEDDGLIQKNLINIGHIYYANQDAEKSLEYYKKALVYSLKSKNDAELSYHYQNIANVFYAINETDSAILYYEKSIEIDKKTGDLYHLGYSYNNMGSLFSSMNKLSEAEKYIKLSIEIREKTGDKEGMATNLSNLASIYFRAKKFDEGIINSQKALSVFLENNSLEGQKNLYKLLSNLYSGKGDLKNEFAYFKKYVELKDSIFNSEKLKIISDIEGKYENEKKQIEILKLQADTDLKSAIIRRQDLLRNSLIGIILLALLAGGASLYAFMLKKKANKKLEAKNQEITIQKNKIELQKSEIIQSINYAQRIQNALLPSEDVFKSILPESYVVFKPKDIVSGDFYWISKQDNRIFYATADCTGHGVPGGFMSMLGTALLNEIIDERRINDCGKALSLIREKIIAALKQADESGKETTKDGMDMVLICLDKDKNEITYAAANNSLYVISSKEPENAQDYKIIGSPQGKFLIELPYDKMPVGMHGGKVTPFITRSFKLNTGDLIFTYTDGYADQFGGEKGKKYTYKRLRELLLHISAQTVSEQKEILHKEFEGWKNSAGQEQVDDVCLIGVRV